MSQPTDAKSGRLTRTRRFKQTFDRWLEGRTGAALLAAERRCVDAQLANLFGYYIVQLGERGGVDWLSGSRIRNRVYLDIDRQTGQSADGRFSADAAALPLESDAIDVVVLPHVLEFEQHPHQVLREVERVLIGEGHVVIVAFNPWSFMGIWRAVLGRRELPPWCGRFRGAGKLQDWLSLLGMDIVATDFVFHRPPIGSARMENVLAGFDRYTAACLPFLGGAFVIVGKKRVAAMTPLNPRWSARPRLIASGIAKPSTRVADLRRVQGHGR